MLDETAARALGWDWTIDGEDAVVSKDGVERFQVTSGTPLYTTLCEIADLEGQERPPLETAIAEGADQ